MNSNVQTFSVHAYTIFFFKKQGNMIVYQLQFVYEKTLNRLPIWNLWRMSIHCPTFAMENGGHLRQKWRNKYAVNVNKQM